MDKNKYNNERVGGFGEVLQSSLQKLGEHYFGTRAKLNEEKILVLSTNDNFISDINKARIFLKIPKLDPHEDFRTFEYDGGTMEDSGFLYGKNNNYIVKFEREIRKLLKKYSLPINFTDWIEYAVLYNKFLKIVPKYNSGIIDQIAHDTKEANRIGLTTKEKQFVKDYIRLKMKTEQMPKQEFDYFYKTICSKIRNSKNHYRPSKSITTAVKALNKPNIKNEYDWTTGKESKIHFSFEELADKISHNKINELETKKIAGRLRQQKHRILRKILQNNK